MRHFISKLQKKKFWGKAAIIELFNQKKFLFLFLLTENRKNKESATLAKKVEDIMKNFWLPLYIKPRTKIFPYIRTYYMIFLVLFI